MMELHVCNRAGEILKAFALGDSVEVLVGRDESCDIRIESKAVSREHCAIEHEGNELVLRDLGSTSGTFLKGEKVDRIKIMDGMEVEVGPAVLKFHDAGL